MPAQSYSEKQTEESDQDHIEYRISLVTENGEANVCVSEDTRAETNKALPDDAPKSTCCSQRWIVAFMGGWLGFMMYLFSMNMSVTVVCMVKQETTSPPLTSMLNISNNLSMIQRIGDTSSYSDNYIIVDTEQHTYTLDDHPLHNQHNHLHQQLQQQQQIEQQPDEHHQAGEFTWSKKEQSFILSGYFYSYMFIQIPGGWLGARFGGRRVVGTAMTVACVLTLLTPVMARSSLYLLVAGRTLLGLCLGTVVSNFCGLVGVWALPAERGRMVGLLFIGNALGTIVAYSTSGILCVHGFDNGWPSSFYIHGLFVLLVLYLLYVVGIVGVVFALCWWYCVYNSPGEHPRISKAELHLLMSRVDISSIRKKRPTPIPWRNILTHIPLYVSYLAHICDTWTYYFIVICLPQYMKEVLHFDIQSNGLLSCLPMVTNLFGCILASGGGDLCRARSRFNVTTIRKIFLVTGFVGVSVCMIIPGYLTSAHSAIAIMCISIGTTFEALVSVGGYSYNSVDIAPKYSSVIFGISNTLGSISGIVVPVAVAIITENQTIEEWRIVFFISAGVSVFGCIVYLLFANNEPVKWGVIKEDIEQVIEVPLNSDLGIKPDSHLTI